MKTKQFEVVVKCSSLEEAREIKEILKAQFSNLDLYLVEREEILETSIYTLDTK